MPILLISTVAVLTGVLIFYHGCAEHILGWCLYWQKVSLMTQHNDLIHGTVHMNVVGNSCVRRWTLLVTDTTRHLTNWMVKPYFEAIFNNSKTTTMHLKSSKNPVLALYVSGKIITVINFHTLWDIWHLCTSKRTKIPCLSEQFHMFYFLFECVVYVYFWHMMFWLLLHAKS